MTNTCICGRTWTHCRLCGSRNIYRKKFESNFQSKQVGEPVDVLFCKRCGSDSISNQLCTAPPETRGTFVPKPVEIRVIPNANDVDFIEKANARLSELRDEGHPMEECVVIMVKEGWPIDQATPTAPPIPEPVSTPTEQKPIEPEISLDEIIKQMTGPKERL